MCQANAHGSLTQNFVILLAVFPYSLKNTGQYDCVNVMGWHEEYLREAAHFNKRENILRYLSYKFPVKLKKPAAGAHA